MIFDPIYWLVIGAGALLSIGASWLTKSRFRKYSQLETEETFLGR